MITWKDNGVASMLKKLQDGASGLGMAAAHDMADTLLILSRHEVPHDEGMLQASGHTAPEADGWICAYNSIYAAFQHEGLRRDGSHVIRRYQKGRKKKFLEDPLLMNQAKWNEIAKKTLSTFIKNGGSNVKIG